MLAALWAHGIEIEMAGMILSPDGTLCHKARRRDRAAAAMALGEAVADAVVGLGMMPPVAPQIIEMSPNGAGFGAAMMLDPGEFARAERIASAAEQVDLDLDPEFDRRYVRSLRLTAD